MTLSFHVGDLESFDVQALLDFHCAQMHAISPPEACHVLPAVEVGRKGGLRRVRFRVDRHGILRQVTRRSKGT